MFIKYRNQVDYWLAVLYDCYLAKQGIFVLGYTKTGTNWLRNLIRHYYQIDQGKGFFRKRVHHMHRFVSSKYFEENTIYIVRDGRDSVVSRYFTMVRQLSQKQMKEDFISETGLRPNEENIKELLPAYIKFLINYKKSSIDYKSHILKALEKNFYTIKYEDLHGNTRNTLIEVLNHIEPGATINEERIDLAIEKSSVKNQDRKTGFFRKDGAKKGGWIKYFTLESAEAFNEYSGDLLIKLGYEKNPDWINQFKQ